MFNLQLFFGNIATSFLFKTEKTLASALQALEKHEGIAVFEDDYGSKAEIKILAINGRIVEDMDKSSNGQIDRALHQAKTQNRLQVAASNDPVLKMQAMRGNGSLPIQRGGM